MNAQTFKAELCRIMRLNGLECTCIIFFFLIVIASNSRPWQSCRRKKKNRFGVSCFYRKIRPGLLTRLTLPGK